MKQLSLLLLITLFYIPFSYSIQMTTPILIDFKTQQIPHVTVKNLGKNTFEFPIQIDLDEQGRAVYAQRIQGALPFIEQINITAEKCILTFTPETTQEGAENGLKMITTIFNYQSFEIK